jgi:hypothetical protein
MVFCGENVVSWWLLLVIWMVVFRTAKKAAPFEIFLWIFRCPFGGQIEEVGREQKVGRPVGVVDGFSPKDSACAIRESPN